MGYIFWTVIFVKITCVAFFLHVIFGMPVAIIESEILYHNLSELKKSIWIFNINTDS